MLKLTIPQLRSICRHKRIYGVSKMNKKTLRVVLAKNMGELYEFKEYNDILYIILSQYIPQEYWCKIGQVSKTYKKIIDEIGFSPWYCMCSRCEAAVLKGEYCIYNDLRWFKVFDDKRYYISVLRWYLDNIENEKIYYNKVKIFYDMFCSITVNKKLMVRCAGLEEQVRIKLVEMSTIPVLKTSNIHILNRILGNIFLGLIFPDTVI